MSSAGSQSSALRKAALAIMVLTPLSASAIIIGDEGWVPLWVASNGPGGDPIAHYARAVGRMRRLDDSKQRACTAAIISESNLLSAAHCDIYQNTENVVELPSGNFTSHLASLRSDVAFNSRWSWSNLLQYDNTADRLGINR